MVKLSQYALGCRNTVGDGWFRMQFQSAAAIARRTCIVPKLRWWCHWTSGNNHVKVFYKCNLFTSQNDQSSTTRPGVGYWRNYWNSVNWWNRRTTWRSSSRCTGRGNVLLIKLSLVWSWWWCDVVLNRISFLHARPDSFSMPFYNLLVVPPFLWPNRFFSCYFRYSLIFVFLYWLSLVWGQWQHDFFTDPNHVKWKRIPFPSQVVSLREESGARESFSISFRKNDL